MPSEFAINFTGPANANGKYGTVTPLDTTPDAFNFSPVTGAALSTEYTSSVTIAGIAAAASISIVDGEYKIDDGSYTAAPGTVSNGQVVTVRLTASAVEGGAVSATLTVGGVSDTFTVTTGGALSGDWLISADYKVGQKLPMNVIYPRPDAETTAYAVHRKTTANETYSMRVCIQGGEPPFKFEIISGGVGATIAEEYDRAVDPTGLILHTMPEDYATVFWPTPSGTANWVVRVTDQSLDTVDVVWSTTTDESAFLWVDAVSGNDANPGTFASRKKTWSTGVWEGGDAGASYAQKIVKFFAGTYSIYAAAPLADCSINAADKARSYVGVEPGVVLNASQGHLHVNTGNIAFINMEITGSRTDLENNKIISVATKDDNYLFWKVRWSDSTPGTLSGDNPACVAFWDGSEFSNYIAFADCSLASDVGMQMVTTFTSKGVLAENCVLENIDLPYNNGSQGIHFKDDTQDCTIRFCTASGFAASGMLVLSNQQNAGLLAKNQEVCYNTLDVSSGAVSFNQAALDPNVNAENTHCYRNSIKVASGHATTAQRWHGGEAVQYSGNAYVSPSGLAYDQSESGGFVLVSPVNISMAAGDINSTTGALTNATGKRTAHLGKVGSEIASTGAV